MPLLYLHTPQEKTGYHGGPGSSLSWGSKAIVYNRYLVGMTFFVRIEGNNTPKRISKAVYYVYEVKDWDSLLQKTYGNGRYLKSLLGVISESQWEKVKKVDDIFKILNHKPVKNKPSKAINEMLIFY